MSGPSTQANTVTIQVLDKEYQVHCPPGEREALLRSAKELDERMRAIRKNGSVIGLERIAIMAALNLSYDLLATRSEVENKLFDAEQVQRLDGKLGRVLEGFNNPG